MLDIEAVATIAHANGMPLVIDNTFATPYVCRPIDYGADIVVHSLTKFMGGHGNSIGGIIVDGGKFDWKASGKFPQLTEPSPAYHGMNFSEVFGNHRLHHSRARRGPARHGHRASARSTRSCSCRASRRWPCAWTCTLPTPGRGAASGKAHAGDVGELSFAAVEQILRAAQKYTPKGAGAVFTFGIKGGYDAGRKFIDSLKLFSHLANVGDARSLVIHPASTTHQQLTPEQQEAAGVTPDQIRLSIGLEDLDDILWDLDQALDASQR